MFGLTKQEMAVFKKLTTPVKIQAYLNTLPINYEKKGETNYSPRLVLRNNKAHCLEGALFAAAALWIHGKEPLLLDLRANPLDEDHVVTLYKINGYWGALSKTNHSVLRFRDPVYKTIHELSLSYFHEYYSMRTGVKGLRSYSKPYNMKKLGTKWITTEDNMEYMIELLDDLPHKRLFSKKQDALIRDADAAELRVGLHADWHKDDPRT